MKILPTVVISLCCLVAGIGIMFQGEWISSLELLALSVLLTNSLN